MARGSRLYTPGLYFLISISLCGSLQADDGPVLGTRVQFVDVAAEVGVSLMNVSGDGQQQYVVDAFIGGSAFFDYDRDGDLDLYVLNGSRVEDFRPGSSAQCPLPQRGRDVCKRHRRIGLGDTGWGMGCAVADYDNDGDADLYVTNYGSNALYENRGEGAFVDVAQRAGVFGEETFSTGCAFFDYDRDGDLDLYVANYVDFDHFMETTPDRRHEWRGLTVHFGRTGCGERRTYSTATRGEGVFSDATAAAVSWIATCCTDSV